MSLGSLLNFTLFTFSSLIVILDPVGMIPPYLAITANLNEQDTKVITKRAILVSAGVLLVTSLAGTWIFKIFGITAEAFRIAGGAVLFIIALDMLSVRMPRAKSSPEERDESIERTDISVFPLAIPLIAGPGSITTVLMLGQRAANLAERAILVLAILICLFAMHLILTRALKIADYLGRIGMNVLTRLMGLVLAAIAVQFVLDGIRLSGIFK